MSDSRGYALSGSSLISFDLANPSTGTIIGITGLLGEPLVGIDFRPDTGFLYGLGVNAVFDTMTLYAISTETGVAAAIAAPFSVAGVDLLPGDDYGFDFNPTVDRIRVTSSSGLNIRINPNTGTLAAKDPDIAGSSISGVAYTNTGPNDGVVSGITTLYSLDSTADVLNIQNPANAGTQNLVGPTGVNFSTVNGFDIPAGIDAPATGSPVPSGSGFALLTVGGTVGLYTLDLVTGAATLVDNFLGGIPASGLAIQSDLGGLPAVAISDDGLNLIRFNTATPGITSSLALSPLPNGETLVGIDFRPQTGQLYGFGVNAATNTGTLYLISAAQGGHSTVGVAGSIHFDDAFGNPVDLPASGYAMDFDPRTPDRIRITTDSGLNFRIDPSTGAAVDSNPLTPAIDTDGPINGLPPGSTGVSAGAYTNSYGQPLGGVTTFYALDATSNSLFIQNPVASGTENSQLTVTLGGSVLDFTSVNGFDIPEGVITTSLGSPAIGFGYAGLTVGGVTSLYRIDLATGEATNLGAIGAGTTQIGGFTLGHGLAVPVITSDGGGATANVSIAENTKAVTTVVAIDPFRPVTEYSIVGGFDATKFQIDATTGALSLITAPDFEAPTDLGHNNTYIVKVRASDGGLSDDQTITVTVTDVANEAAPPPHWIGTVGLAAHPAGWLPIGVNDLNADGTGDIVWFNAATGNLDLWKITNGVWAGSANVGTHALGAQPRVGDLNGDGTNDVLWHNAATGSVDLWTISNGQLASTVNLGSHPIGYQVAGVGDFTGDGISDVLWNNPTTGAVEIWKIVNGQWSATLDLGSHPTGWQSAGVGDFNHDGTSDVLWFNPTTGGAEIWQIANGQWKASVDLGSHPLGWAPVGIGDFNRDGVSDVAWFNSASGNVEVWEIVNSHWAASVNLGNHPVGWTPSGIGDLNHDLTSDILWRENNTGLTETWLLSNG